jgi:aspartate ammonia-lyase
MLELFELPMWYIGVFTMTNGKERDLIGWLEVPFVAYNGIHTQRTDENHRISGGWAHRQLIWGVGMIKMGLRASIEN